MVSRLKSRKAKRERRTWVLWPPRRSTAPFGVPHSWDAAFSLSGLQLTSCVSHKDPGVRAAEAASSSPSQGPPQTAVTGEPLQPVTLARPQVWLPGSPTRPAPALFLPFLSPHPSSPKASPTLCSPTQLCRAHPIIILLLAGPHPPPKKERRPSHNSHPQETFRGDRPLPAELPGAAIP